VRIAIITGTRGEISPEDAVRVAEAVRWSQLVIVGDCPTGVDPMARAEAKCGTGGPRDLMVFDADWDALGKRAGPMRNKDMVRAAIELSQYPPHHDVRGWAFPGPKSRGTWDCIQRIVAAGFRCTVIPVNH
jgi:hypothetical protein